jgi:hypothetical protein
MKIRLFPGHNIESTWWTRLLKVFIIVLTVAFFLIFYFGTIQPDAQRQPYYAYSFDPNFNAYPESVINCGGVPGKCIGATNTDPSDIVIAYQDSSPSRDNQVQTMFATNPNITYDQVLENLESNGDITNNLQVKDINNVNGILLGDWFSLIAWTVVFFLALTQIFLRTIFYIVYGRRKS